MIAALAKAIFLSVAAIMLDVASTPPQPPPRDKDNIYRVSLFERTVLAWMYLLRVTWWTVCLCPAFVISAPFIGGAYTARAAATLCPAPRESGAITAFVPSFTIGWIMAAGGSCLRMWCFKILAHLFTFEVTVQKEHKLITTGPYAVVRHPSYLGSYLVFVGVPLMVFGRGGYVAECGILSTQAKWAAYAWLALIMYFAVSVWKRTGIEDTMLRESLGDEWLRYRQRVPYRLLPGVI